MAQVGTRAGDERWVVGCMTGTSLDGLDAALVRVRGRGLAMRAEFVGGVTRPLGDIGVELRRLADQHAMTAGAIAEVSRRFALLHAEAVQGLTRAYAERMSAAGGRLALIAVHGQTVFHRPPVSWQMFNPWPLVHAVGAPVVFDLRGADLAAGGQGAPITPLADWVLFRARESRAIVNLGGFCNVTLVPAVAEDERAADGERAVDGERASIAGVRGFDVCACNHLLDALAKAVMGAPFDDGGRVALSGTVRAEAMADLSAVLSRQAGAGRSLGSGDEAVQWIERWRGRASAADLGATMAGAIAGTIAARVGAVERVLLAGGGAHNGAVVAALRVRCAGVVEPIDAAGVPVGFREAMEMGVLGALCADGEAITLPGVTGVAEPAPISGCWAGGRA